MIGIPLKSCCLSAFVFLCLQSLADIAREEAERRRSLDQQGIEAKVITSVPQDDRGNIAVSTIISTTAPKKTSKESAPPKASLGGITAAIQKLDRGIRQTQERLESRRALLQSERWAIPKTGRASANRNTEKVQSRLKEEIENLERKLNQLRQERSEVYDRGRKAGFLPGEITGKGIIP
jgi:hypothetical protein